MIKEGDGLFISTISFIALNKHY